MPDNNEEIQAVRSAFDEEAKKWMELAQLMTDLRNRTADLYLVETAFFCGSPLTSHEMSRVYNEIYELVRGLMDAATKEFDQIAGALHIARDTYETSDQDSAATIVKIYGS